MKSSLLSLPMVIAAWSANLAPPAWSTDWPQWRGPNHDNKAPTSAQPVTEWSESQNVRWKTPIPGRGHSTPIFIGNRIYLTTADTQKATQSLLALERQSGKLLWETVIHRKGLSQAIHRENSHASSTPQWTGQRILVTFENGGKIHVTAVHTDGKIDWSRPVADYEPVRPFGFGSTPVLHDGALLIASDSAKKGSLTSIDAETGEELWKVPRTGSDNYASPVVAKVAGKEQLVISGFGKMSSYDPKTGETLWTAPFSPDLTCNTAVWTEDMVFASGGFPTKETVGVKADGSGTVVWKNREKSYEQSLLSHKGLIYAVTDQGVAFCWDAGTGEEYWSERIGRGGVMASPLLVGDLIFATIKNGTTVILKTGKHFEKVAENRLGQDTYASPVALDDELFLRVGRVDQGNRQEMLYCLGK
ncbi:MAG: PQQ-binding-like beta-propeller repeat protein [Verrucomicrobiales bacterium]